MVLCGFLAISILVGSTVGQVIERAYEQREMHMARGARRADLAPLKESCAQVDREEKRLWLIGEIGAVYLLRLFGPTVEQPMDGELYAFERSRTKPLHLAHDYNWEVVAEAIRGWQELDSRFFEAGQRSFLLLVVESCREGVFDVRDFWGHQAPEQEQRAAATIKGFVLSLDAAEPPEGTSERSGERVSAGK